jgi:hypothetical protein
VLREIVRRYSCEPLIERQDENVLDACLRKELEPAFERCKQLDTATEHGPWVRVECHHARPQPWRPRGIDDLQMAPVHAVERPDSNGAPTLR